MLPLLFFLALRLLEASVAWSRNVENPTVPPVLRGPKLEKSIWPDLRLTEAGVVWGFFDDCRTPIFCNCPTMFVSIWDAASIHKTYALLGRRR